MKLDLHYEVDGCYNCPMKRNHYGHGENWDYCAHDDAPEGYDKIIDMRLVTGRTKPEWCPIAKKVPSE